MAFAIDSDTFRLLNDGQETVVRRVQEQQAAGAPVLLSAIVAQEAVEGALAQITRRQRANSQIQDVEEAYDLLHRTLIAISGLPFLPYTAAAEALFRAFPASVKRVGTNDCRIAASAITSGLTIVTRNARDYERIPGAVFVDWASEP